MKELTSKDDLYGHVPGIAQYHPGEQSARSLTLGISSGTTKGTPTLVVVSRAHTTSEASYPYMNERAYGNDHAVLRLSNSAQNTHRLMTEVWQLATPKRFMVASKQDIDTPAFYKAIEEFAPAQIDTQPAMIMHLLTTLQEANAKRALAILRENVQSVVFAGEKMSEAQRMVIHTLLPHAITYCDYSLTETPWWFASTCPVHPDPDTSRLCIAPHFTDAVWINEPDETDAGEIIVHTKELGYYRTGDIGMIEEQACPCGSKKRLIVHGRLNYDIVSCVGATFLISEVDRVFEKLGAYVSDYLVEVGEEVDERTAVRGRVHLNVVPTPALEQDPIAELSLRNAFEKQLFVTKTKVLAELIEQNVFLPTTISFMPSIPRGTKHIRLRRS